MSRRTILISALLAAATASPAAALAADNELRGHPQAYLVDDDTVRVEFATDERVAKRGGARITLSDRGSTTRVVAKGRHGEDFTYVAHVELRRSVEAGRKYTVTFRLAGGEPEKRLVLVRAQQ